MFYSIVIVCMIDIAIVVYSIFVFIMAILNNSFIEVGLDKNLIVKLQVIAVLIFDSLINLHRSYGVVLWEITSYGESPLDDMEAKDVIEAAQDRTLSHPKLDYNNSS